MKRANDKGFTIIELLLAMSGISFLLLFVVFGIIHVTGLYTKGLAIRDIAQVSRQVIEDMTRDIRYGSVVKTGPTGSNRLCVGSKSYVWNPNGTSVNVYTDDTPVNFVAVDDGTMCTPVAGVLPKVPLSSEKLLGNIVILQELKISQLDMARPLYDVRLVLSTSGDNAPDVTVVSGVNKYECSPTYGQFCAFGDFDTTVYARSTK